MTTSIAPSAGSQTIRSLAICSPRYAHRSTLAVGGFGHHAADAELLGRRRSSVEVPNLGEALVGVDCGDAQPVGAMTRSPLASMSRALRMSVDEPGMRYSSIVAMSMWAHDLDEELVELLGHVVVDAAERGVLALVLPEVGRSRSYSTRFCNQTGTAPRSAVDLLEEIEVAVSRDLGELGRIWSSCPGRASSSRSPPVVVDGVAEECHPRSLVLGEVAAGEVAVLEVRLDAMVESQPSLLDQVGAVERRSPR